MTEAHRTALAGSDDATERAPRLTATVNGTIVAAGVLAVSAADQNPNALDAGLYALATVFVFWLAHGWAHALGFRAAGRREHSLLHGLRHELPVLEAVVPPLAALAIAALFDATEENAITIAAWVCVAQLGILGAGVARREGESLLGIARTAIGCAALGIAMILLKAIVH